MSCPRDKFVESVVSEVEVLRVTSTNSTDLTYPLAAAGVGNVI